MPTARLLTLAVCALAALIAAPTAQAARKPTAKEKAAFQKAFFKVHPKETAAVDKISVSTADKRFAAIRYSVKLAKGPGTLPESHKATTPAYAKKGKGGKVAIVTPSKLPGKVVKDLGKPKRKSNIRITGAYTATLTQPARCSRSGSDTYTMYVYDPTTDVGVDLDIFEFRGGVEIYQLRQVWSVAGLAIGNQMTTHNYETTWGEADVPKGQAYVDIKTGGGVISATMGPQPPPEEDNPENFVFVDGTWECR